MNHEKTETEEEWEMQVFIKKKGIWNRFDSDATELAARANMLVTQKQFPEDKFRLIRVTTTREVVE